METIQQNQHRKHPYVIPVVWAAEVEPDISMQQTSIKLPKTQDPVDDSYEPLVKEHEQQEQANKYSLW